MTKKLVIVWLSLTILIFSSISIYAGEAVKGNYLLKDIVVNDAELANYESEDPFFSYRDLIYVPLSDEMGNILGFEVKMDTESRTLKIIKKDITQKDFKEKWVKHNSRDFTAYVVDNMKVVASVDGLEYDIQLSGYPVLSANDAYYIPLKSIVNLEYFGWDSFFDVYSGVYISTEEDVEAKSLYNEPRSRYNRGLTNYIVAYGKNQSTSGALELAFLFRYNAEIYGIDMLKLMAVAEKESTFDIYAVGSSGSTGLMQVMPATAAERGVQRSQLYDPYVSVQFAAQYLSERLDAYNGDWTKTLASYNQGAGAVSRGSYTTRYAQGVYSKESQIENYLENNGYGTGQ